MPKRPLTKQEVLYRMEALCSRAEQAPADVRQKIARLGLPAVEAEKVMRQLIQNNYLNEARYAAAFTHDKLQFEGWGRIKIAYRLKMKGISQDAINAALANIDEEAYISTLQKCLLAKAKTLAGKTPIEAKAALVRFAASRGFEQNMIFKHISIPDSDD